MPLNLRTPGGTSGGAGAASYPIARSYALVILAALIALIVLRHLFGSVHLEAGVR